MVPAAYFNSRPCVRGDLFPGTSYHRVSIFQFTPLREGRLDGLREVLGITEIFQFTPLREGRLEILQNPESRDVFQFTPLREGRRCIYLQTHRLQKISIHAPA